MSIVGSSAMATPPNVVVVFTDDQGWGDLSCQGSKDIETPHIDKMRTQGMHFDAAYSGGPNCAPTRGCLMSGTYTPRHHIYQPGGLSKGKVEYMKLLVPAREQKDKELKEKAANAFKITNSRDPKFISLAEMMNPAGYETARLGKWHLGPDRQGFDLSTTNGKGAIGDKYYGNIDVAEDLTNRALEFIARVGAHDGGGGVGAGLGEGHTWVLQLAFCHSGGQVKRPHWWLTVRTRTRWPPPHEAEQEYHTDQLETTQFRGHTPGAQGTNCSRGPAHAPPPSVRERIAARSRAFTPTPPHVTLHLPHGPHGESVQPTAVRTSTRHRKVATAISPRIPYLAPYRYCVLETSTW